MARANFDDDLEARLPSSTTHTPAFQTAYTYQMNGAMRPLTLHASALNDAEYDLYTTSLNDLAWAEDGEDGKQTHDDAYYEQMRIGVREARGWLRGRYAHLALGDIDAILRLFSPGMRPADVLSGGQFFAALRLVVHAENGKAIERGLAFVQGRALFTGLSVFAHYFVAHPCTSASPPSVPRRHPIAPPTPASMTRTIDTASNPFSAPLLQPPHTAHNPFVSRPSQPHDPPPRGPPLPPRKPHSILSPPPKHGSILLPPNRTSVSPTRPAPPSGTATPPTHPPIPAKPAHVTSTLMKQSLQASKAGQTMKRAESQLEQERVLQVLKSSAVVSGGYSLSGANVSRSSVVVGTQVRTTHNVHHHQHQHPRSASPGAEGVVMHAQQAPVYAAFDGNTTSSLSVSSGEEGGRRGRAPPLPRRRNTHTQQPSPPVSVSSLEQVALAMPPPQPPPPPPPLPPSSLSLTSRSSTLTNPFPSNNNPYHQRPLPLPLPDASTTYSASPRSSPARPTVDLPPPPSPTTTSSTSTSTRPPTHPDRKPPPFPFASAFHAHTTTTTPSASSPFTPTRARTPTTPLDSGGSPTARVFRSKSLHHPSPPPPMHPPPPPRRKRPESVQVLGSPSGDCVFGAEEDRNASPATDPTPFTRLGHRRQSSLSLASAAAASSKSTPEESALSKLARSWQPRLEKARYKAEAGLMSRRGYVAGAGGEKEDLIAGGAMEEDNAYEPASVDEEEGWRRL
ncbi:hypothetical protein D9615_006307 [Tricholomella constricta]|uniref:Uncharacterized protein n=1 Tax=Tricholomella constricta TaxID=117010 RepID=A0A8H5HBH1_9AGAR|nr:hypothetical protein D9615_006307 [Tricholomella constricta]